MSGNAKRRALALAVAALALLEAGWMAFDGAHALVTGDYVTPSEGPYAGQLGPWAPIAAAAGVEPRGTPMKIGFLAYGVAWLLVTGAFLAGARWGAKGMAAAAIGSLWYLVVGTAFSLLQLALLAWRARLLHPPDR